MEQDYKRAIALFEANVNFVGFFISKYFPQLIGDEGIYQEALVGLWKACQAYDENKSKLLSFASTCIRNEILKELRRRAKTMQLEALHLEDLISTEEEELQLSEILPDPTSQVEKSEVFVKDFFNQLAARDKQIVSLLIQGANRTEIAKLLGISRSYCSRCVTRIGKDYKAWESGEPKKRAKRGKKRKEGNNG